MPTKIPNTKADAGQQVTPRRHDSGSGANETTDGLDASTEALRHAAEDTPSVPCQRMLRSSRYLTAPTSHRKFRCNHGEEKARRLYRNTHGSASSRTRPLDSIAAYHQRKCCSGRSGGSLVRVLSYLDGEIVQ